MPDLLRAADLVVGQRYHAEIQDCCVTGEFTAVVTSITLQEDDPCFIEQLVFHNGVTLTEAMGGVTFTLLPDDPDEFLIEAGRRAMREHVRAQEQLLLDQMRSPDA